MCKSLSTILSWAAEEGWNPGLDDAAAFSMADKNGFFIHEINGQPVAAISVVNHSETFAFLGLYLCRPEFRGQGHGLALWNRAIKHAGSRTIGLDGVPDQQANYQKSGFALCGQTVRWQGVLDARQNQTRDVSSNDFNDIMELDQRQVGFKRQKFLRNWLEDSDTRRSLLIERNGQAVAYGTVRRCLEGFKIGPFAADNKADAVELLAGLSAVFAMQKIAVMIDIPAQSTALTSLMQNLGFTPGFETARMYKGQPPQEALAAYSAVATLELG